MANKAKILKAVISAKKKAFGTLECATRVAVSWSWRGASRWDCQGNSGAPG